MDSELNFFCLFVVVVAGFFVGLLFGFEVFCFCCSFCLGFVG